jgi:DNA-binding NarL/FixJ family response regulator
MSSSRRTDPLTVEERAALSLSATGLVVTEVARALGVSPELVREWLASAAKKLRARSKLEAIVIADRLGELDPLP